MPEPLFIGVDVGTQSARAGVFDALGSLLGTASHQIGLWHPQPDFAEHSSADIWQAVQSAVRGAVSAAAIDPAQVAGIGFDATCSMVVEPKEGCLAPASPGGDPEHDTIVWMDHRAIAEAKEVTEGGYDVLRATGGVISPEMQTPKLLWLRRHNPETFTNAAQFFDLPDWLVYRATGDAMRSLCSVVCKWTYRGQAGLTGEGWDGDYFRQIGLGDLAEDGFSRIGTRISAPGAPVGGLSAKAAAELGLPMSVVVGASLIDAHAGALGTLGVAGGKTAAEKRLALIAGTSACHIALSETEKFAPGVWGPYFGAVLPELWATEAGQSLAGAALDAVLHRHSASAGLGDDPHGAVAECISQLAGDRQPDFLTRDLHATADFHGNRAPLADATRKATLVGQGPENGLSDLALTYLSVLQALGYGTRHILDVIGEAGVTVEAIVVSGGLAHNSLYLQAHANITGLPVLVPDQSEPVLLGAAMLGATASGHFAKLADASAAMSGGCRVIEPDTKTRAYHDAKYQVYRQMLDDFDAYRKCMQAVTSGNG